VSMLRSDAKWPRQYAQEIAEAKDDEAKRKVWESVPEHLRNWVAYMVEASETFERKE